MTIFTNYVAKIRKCNISALLIQNDDDAPFKLTIY